MKSIKLAAVLIIFIAILFSCKKDKPDERVYGRWKITEYYLDGQPAFDTILKYLDGYEYEIRAIKASSSQSYCGCSSWIRIFDYGQIMSSGEQIAIGNEGNNYVDYYFYPTRLPRPPCPNNPAHYGIFECNNQWAFSFALNKNQMKWQSQDPTPRSHEVIFTKID